MDVKFLSFGVIKVWVRIGAFIFLAMIIRVAN